MRKPVYAVMALWVAGLLVGFPTESRAQYLGAARCKACHLVQSKSWEQTGMAKSFEVLKPGAAAKAKTSRKLDPKKDYTRDAACISCHVTGFGKPGGFVSIEKTPLLAGVQCETCHGPGGGYLKPNLMSLQNKEYKRAELLAAGLTAPEDKICITCHNEKSPFYKPFDFKVRKPQVHEHLALKFPH